MKREEQILKAGIEYTIANKPKCIAGDNFKDLADIFNKNPDFEAGAMWADAHPHWISVEDELPPDNEAFIAYWNHFVIVQQGRDERFGSNKHITHWMPLPSGEH